MRRLLVAVLAVGSLCGCSMMKDPAGIVDKLWPWKLGRDYERLAVDIPASFRSAADAAKAPGSAGGPPGPSGSLADLAWLPLFQDPVLHSLIPEALAKNYDLQAAVARVEQAR